MSPHQGLEERDTEMEEILKESMAVLTEKIIITTECKAATTTEEMERLPTELELE